MLQDFIAANQGVRQNSSHLAMQELFASAAAPGEMPAPSGGEEVEFWEKFIEIEISSEEDEADLRPLVQEPLAKSAKSAKSAATPDSSAGAASSSGGSGGLKSAKSAKSAKSCSGSAKSGASGRLSAASTPSSSAGSGGSLETGTDGRSK